MSTDPPCCKHESFYGIDEATGANKVWRCDECGALLRQTTGPYGDIIYVDATDAILIRLQTAEACADVLRVLPHPVMVDNDLAIMGQWQEERRLCLDAYAKARK